MQEQQNEPPAVPVEEPGPPSASGPRVIQITAQNWSFTPSVIKARKGEVVQLSITGAGGLHGFSVPSLGINENLTPGQTITINLPTDRAGTFPLFCSIPCGSGHRDMTGQIIIE